MVEMAEAGFIVPVANRDGYLVTVTLVVATATEAEAIDGVSAVVRGQQRAWADGSALLDDAIDRITPAPLTHGDAYAEGDAFDGARADDTDTPGEAGRDVEPLGHSVERATRHAPPLFHRQNPGTRRKQ